MSTGDDANNGSDYVIKRLDVIWLAWYNIIGQMNEKLLYRVSAVVVVTVV